ncbi:MAG: response regulator [Cyanobacteriota bacterium]|nr:response regulator [Cyanobacteriota bacterium]
MNTVLVVEDSPVESAIISECLQRANLLVIKAKSAEEALQLIRQKQPDLIVLDVVLPGQSGFELCRELKSEKVTEQIPIVICSTKGSDTDKFWGLAQGANAYLAKPINQSELTQTVLNWLAQKTTAKL